jgi:AcrR family transcriptional regulator
VCLPITPALCSSISAADIHTAAAVQFCIRLLATFFIHSIFKRGSLTSGHFFDNTVNLKTAKPKQATPPSRRAKEFAMREREILKVALNYFGGKRCESVTIAQIASRAGIAKGTMYLHFASKQEIFARLTLDFHHALLDHLQHHTSSKADDYLERLLQLTLRFYVDKPEYRFVTQYCMREDFKRNLNADLAAEFAEVEQAIDQLIKAGLTHGVISGRYRPVAVDQTLLGLRCTFQGALNLLWCHQHCERNNPDQFISDISTYMIAPLLVIPKENDTACNDNCFSTKTEPALRRQTMEVTHE